MPPITPAGTSPANPTPQPAAPVTDPNQAPPFSLGTPSEIPQAPAPPAPAEEVPAWAQKFVTDVTEKITGLEAAISEELATPAPGAPIGAPAGTQSELAKRNPQSWEDVDNYVGEAIQKGVEEGIKGFTENIQAENKRAQEDNARVNADLDAQVDALQAAGMVPAIQNPNDRNDPGRIYRRELYGAAAKLGTTDLKAVAELTLAPLHAKGQMYDPISNSIIDYNPNIPGANAPIGSSSATTGISANAPNYAEIHKARSMDELRERAGM